MTKNHPALMTPFFLALLGTAFCVWSALGNDVNICVTTGCALYQDFSIAGLSLWWLGCAAFALLAICAILGRQAAGARLAALFVLGDAFLLALMAFTAPCVSCLAAALLFALCYFFFRRPQPAPKMDRQREGAGGHSILLWIWLVFFVVNLGQVARSQADVWAILDESGEPRARMFFSPTCTYCAEGINALSGKVDMAFYPLADNDRDVYRIAKMRGLLDEGMSLAEALAQCQDADSGGPLHSLSPEMLLLRFRLLRNKAHVFAAGSQGVPFFEYRGLPPDVMGKSRERGRAQRQERPRGPLDPNLPTELMQPSQCGGAVPCPPAGFSPR